MKIVAVMACPVGMAHTYMASAALAEAAKKMSIEIKIETQGALGIKDRITPSDVKEAGVAILATDVAVLESERFQEIPTLKVQTSKIIRNGAEIIQRALALCEQEQAKGD
jgi:fructose-specific phosphotransferase system IIB component